MFSTLWQCLLHNLTVWSLVYGSAYYFIYYRYKHRFNKYKFNAKYPETARVSKEVLLSFIAIGICSVYDAIILYKKQNAWTSPSKPSWNWLIHPLLVSLFIDAHFYFYHRLCHSIKPLYRHIHSVHHESNNVNPVESAMYFSSLFIVLGLDIPKWMYIVTKFAVMLAPLNGHSGHGNTTKANCKVPLPVSTLLSSSFDHYIHHALFNYNYGSGLYPIWDRLFGTAYKVPAGKYFSKIPAGKK